MCGRFTLTLDSGTIQEMLPWVMVPSNISPRYNIAPSQPVAVIPNDGLDRVDFYVWGLIPSWAKDPQIGNRLINARAETLTEKPAFRDAFHRRRCLILADGFYEWQSQGNTRSKIPYYIRLKSGRLFAFAGLWDSWHAKDGSVIHSCTIITTQANELIRPIHNRMPVIVAEEGYSQWLETQIQAIQMLKAWLKPFPPEEMTIDMVSDFVNNPKNDSALCIQMTGND